MGVDTWGVDIYRPTGDKYRRLKTPNNKILKIHDNYNIQPDEMSYLNNRSFRANWLLNQVPFYEGDFE